jgi:[ribosomal protein S18]-alanine N-acetyltransferase
MALDPRMNPEHILFQSLHPASVRKFDPRDAAAVAEILRGSPEAAEWSVKSIEQLGQRGELGWVVENDGGVTGFLVARAITDEAEVLNLCIDPAKRRFGNATALLQVALAQLPRLGAKVLFLEVRETNLPAISFYEKHGFVRHGYRPGYYQNPTEAAVLMRRELTG